MRKSIFKKLIIIDNRFIIKKRDFNIIKNDF